MYDLTAIESMAYHHSMLADEVRTRTFLRAILKTVRRGDVVLDLGSGTGLLAYYACISGAKRVYAVEAGPIVELARRVCRHNGFQDHVVFLNDWSTNVDLPEPVDVIVTETIGNVGFDEGILHWIRDAKERFLVEGGRIVPGAIELVVVPAEANQEYAYVDSWNQTFHSLDYSPARSLAVNNMLWANLSAESCLSEPASLVRVVTAQALTADIDGELAFVASRDGILHGIGTWFAAELAPGEWLSNGPPLRTPSWSQVLLPLERPLPVQKGDHISVQVRTHHSAVHWQWQASVNSMADLQSSHQAAARSQQETIAGELRAADPIFSRSHMPVRNEDAQVDLFILSAMDGASPVKTLAEELMSRFPDRFTSEEGALEHIYDLVEVYCRWEAIDAPETAGRGA